VHVTRPTRGITGRSYLERGKPVVVLVQWSGKGPRNVLIRRADGSTVVRPFRGLRRHSNDSPSHIVEEATLPASE
jgi:acetyl esterase